MSLGDLADRALERLGDHVFVAQGDARSLLSEVVDRAGRVAGGLRGSGVAPGDRVGVVMTNSPDVLVAYLAIWRAGAVAMPVIPAVTAAELEHVLRDSEARVVLCSPASEDLVASAGAAEVVPSLDRLLEDAAPVVARGDDELAALLYTGGTTGRAKGVMLTHRNLDQTARARAQVVATAGTSDVLVPLPMSHVFGLINAVSRLHVPTPGTLHLQGRFDAAEWVRIVARERVEASAVVPSMLQLLLGQPLENADRSSLTYITSGGAPLALAVRQEVERRIPTARVCDGYGCTEVCSTATMNPPDARRDDSVGTPLPGVRLRCRTGGCGPATSGGWTRTGTCTSSTGSRTSSSAAGSTSTRATSRTPCSSTRPCLRQRWSVALTRCWARRSWRTCSWVRRRRRRSCSPSRRSGWRRRSGRASCTWWTGCR
jgi:long-chain acyl-CoA synthetase